MAYGHPNYKPHKRQAAILARAWEHIQSIPYTTTARWLFYRLLQEGYYSQKDDYNVRFLPLLSRARHSFYQGWRPDTLADNRREPIIRGAGYETPDDWVTAIAERGACSLSRWYNQQYYVELWFEAGAMVNQFKHYTHSITLRPFYGMPSIPYKWDIAKALEQADRIYGLPIIVIYFGDNDLGGMTIPETSIADIRGWCGVRFDVQRAGLNPGDETRYDIPENPEHPGVYQWEALDDDAARELITSSVARYVDSDAMQSTAALEKETTRRFREHVKRLIN